MSGWGPYFFPAFLLLVLAWVGLSAFAILSRALYDRRRRAARAAQDRLRALIVGSGEGSIQVLDNILSDLPLSVVEEIAADSITEKWQAEALAGYALRRGGAQRWIRPASRRHSPAGKRRRIAALRILALGGDPNAVPLLDRALRDRDSDVVGAAIVTLGGIGDESAAHILIDALRSRLYAPSRIATQLDRFSKPIPNLLLPLLRHPIPVVRFWGATLLARYSGSAEININLAALRGDPDPGVRKAALETLGKIGGPQSAETAIALIKDPVWFVRAHAARTIGDLRRVDLCHMVTPLLTDREWWVRTAAKDALEAMGPAVAEHLIGSLSSTDTFARNGAAEVLQNLGILDALVSETINTAEQRPERVDLIGRILAAGGPDLIRIAVARADPGNAAAAMQLIRKAAVRYGLAS